jgi:hypothetical protein
MTASLYPSGQAITQALAAAAGPVTATDPPPDALLRWLARLRLLEGVPFAYLVVDAGLLPPESIRFFHVDRNWTDAAVDGALAAGAGTSRERAHLQARHQVIRDAVDAAERNAWAADAHPDQTYAPAASETLTGFLLRSRVVSGWPGLHVRAVRDGTPVRPARMARLAPAVLLVIFDGLPTSVTIEEPRQGLQFGFDLSGGGYQVPVRDTTTGNPTGTTVAARFRPGAPGVVDVAALAADLGSAATNPAELAFQLVQPPFRQDFSGPPPAAATATSITLAELSDAFGEAP